MSSPPRSMLRGPEWDEFEAMADQNREFIAVDENRFEQAVRDLEERYGQQIEQLRIEVAQLKQEKAVLAQERDLAKNEAIEAMEKGTVIAKELQIQREETAKMEQVLEELVTSQTDLRETIVSNIPPTQRFHIATLDPVRISPAKASTQPLPSPPPTPPNLRAAQQQFMSVFDEIARGGGSNEVSKTLLVRSLERVGYAEGLVHRLRHSVQCPTIERQGFMRLIQETCLHQTAAEWGIHANHGIHSPRVGNPVVYPQLTMMTNGVPNGGMPFQAHHFPPRDVTHYRPPPYTSPSRQPHDDLLGPQPPPQMLTPRGDLTGESAPPSVNPVAPSVNPVATADNIQTFTNQPTHPLPREPRRERVESMREILGFAPPPEEGKCPPFAKETSDIPPPPMSSPPLRTELESSADTRGEAPPTERLAPGAESLFGVGLSLSVERASRDGIVPSLIDEALHWLNGKSSELRGDIWRMSHKPFVEERVEGYIELMHKGVQVSFPLEEEPYVVSSLVIRFIRALPEGLFNMRATQALISAKANVSALSVVVSALSLHSRQLLARLFRHLETMVRSGVCNAGELARHLSPHLGRFSEEGIDREGEEAKELVAPIEAMIGFYTEVFGKDKAPLKL